MIVDKNMGPALLAMLASDTMSGNGRTWCGLDFGSIYKARMNNRRNKNQKRVRGNGFKK
jgi:hypothetical protein